MFGPNLIRSRILSIHLERGTSHYLSATALGITAINAVVLVVVVVVILRMRSRRNISTTTNEGENGDQEEATVTDTDIGMEMQTVNENAAGISNPIFLEPVGGNA